MNEFGFAAPKTNSFRELATGLNRLSGKKWIESKPELVITTKGITGQGANHTVLFPATLNSGAIKIKDSQGEIFKGFPLCIAYQDTVSGSNVFFAVVQDSTAQVVGKNKVVYPNAFNGANASVVYTYSRAGISQDIRFNARPPRPSDFGMNESTTHLIVISEVVDTPNPKVHERSWKGGREIIQDQTLQFGSMHMVPGKAFRTKKDKKTADVPVAKQYVVIDGRKLILESLQYARVQADLLQLPTVATNDVNSVTNASLNRQHRRFAQSTLPAAPSFTPHPVGKPRMFAELENGDSFVLDWSFLEDWGNVGFGCGVTTVINGQIYIDSAEVEAQAVVKYLDGSSLEIGDAFTWDGIGGCYDGPMVLTGVRDNSVGEDVASDLGITGDPQEGDYGPAMILDNCSYLGVAQQNTEIYYASAGVTVNGACISTVTITASDSVAVKSTTTPENSATFTVTRQDGAWDQDLTVNFLITGTAVSGVETAGDYETVPDSATIPAGEASKDITIHPHAPTGDAFEKSVRLEIKPDDAYLQGEPDLATVYIEDFTAAAPAPIPAPVGLVSWWRGENDATDALALNNGTLLNGLGYNLGLVGNGFDFDGTDDRFTAASSASLNFGNNADYTIEAWIRPVVANTDYGVQSIIDKRYAPNDWTATGYTLHLINGQLGCQISQNGGVSNFGPAGSDLRDGRFHHVAVTVHRGSDGGHLYVDGSEVLSFTPPTGDLSNTEPFRIGNHASSYLNAYFKGLIDEVAVYNLALTANQILAIHDAGRGGKCIGPLITTQPQSQAVAGGANATLSVAASTAACPPLTYEWFHNGALVVGATTSALQLTGVHLSDAGIYQTIVANNLASVGSSTATLTVQEVAAPVFSPVGGSFASDQNVTVSCATPGAMIYYTLGANPGDPTTGDTPISSGSTILINQNEVLKAKAFKTGSWAPSEVETEGYRIATAGERPTVTISPPTGTAVLASDDLEILVEAADLDGTISKIQLYQDGIKVAEAAQSPLRYTLSEVYSGTYTFTARAIDDSGMVGNAAPSAITVNASGPVVSISGTQPFFTSSPATLIASVIGINPGTIGSLTLNGSPQPFETGRFPISTSFYQQGANTFTLAATDNQSRTAQSSATVYLDSVAPVVSITSPANNASFNTSRINVSGTFTETNLKQITVNGLPALITGNTFTALNVPLSGDIIAISAGEAHNLALTSKGTVIGWGDNSYGQAVPPANLADVVAISAGYYHSLALKSDGTVVGWGRNSSGEATPPANLAGVTAVSAGATHSLALKSDGTVTMWGSCSDYADCMPPLGLADVRSISASWMYSLALKTDGTVIGWGLDDYGQTDVPGAIEGALQISAGGLHALALKQDGTVIGWTDSSYGELDIPYGLNDIVAVSAGKFGDSLALQRSGIVVGWGANFENQAQPPSGLSKVVAISASDFCSFALKSDGTIVGWGDNEYGQLNFPDALKQSTITVTATDISGNTTTTSVIVNRNPDTAGNLTDPVQLQASTAAGFSPLTVTFTPQGTAPGTLQHVYYDFDGDGVTDQTANDLNPITHTYNSAGQFFPVVTVETSFGKFSSLGGNYSPDPNRLQINVRAAPQTPDTISVTDPIDLKCDNSGHLYVLSRSSAAIYEYDITASHAALIRSITGIGTTPTGLDVDSAGNVYVAISGENHVAKFAPFQLDSFQLDTTFGTGGIIGDSGTGNGQFSAPYDVAVSPDGTQISVSDSANNRLQNFTPAGAFLNKFGDASMFNTPRGICYGPGGYLFIVDSGNNRIAAMSVGGTVSYTGGSGTGAGLFSQPSNLSVSSHGNYVADTANNRIQSLAAPESHAPLPSGPSGVRLTVSTGLSSPTAVAAVGDAVRDNVYVADTGNNRVVLFQFPSEDPTLVWSEMLAKLGSQDISAATATFAQVSKDEYERAFRSISSTTVSTIMNSAGILTPIWATDNAAEYSFTDTIAGHTLTFPVKFVREAGAWKIVEF